jgi:hypothetical protein
MPAADMGKAMVDSMTRATGAAPEAGAGTKRNGGKPRASKSGDVEK